MIIIRIMRSIAYSGEQEDMIGNSNVAGQSFTTDRGFNMTVSYEKLWNLARENKMRKGDLARAAMISEYAMGKLGRSQTVPMDVMVRLCKVFHCDIGDLMEVIEE
jgi:putative transcriptional regulator